MGENWKTASRHRPRPLRHLPDCDEVESEAEERQPDDPASPREPRSPTPSRRWGTSPMVFRIVFAVFVAGCSLVWYREVSEHTGQWLELRQKWSWPPSLATVGSAAYYAVSALLSSYLVAVCVTALIDGAKNAHRRIRGR